MHNRRAYHRIARHQKIKIKILAAGGEKGNYGRAFSCSSEDLSIGGLQFSSHRQIDVNAELTLQISFTRPNQTFQHTGKVVWVREDTDTRSYRIGLFFTDKDPQTLIKWRKAIALLDRQ